jgi:hypothetical protein
LSEELFVTQYRSAFSLFLVFMLSFACRGIAAVAPVDAELGKLPLYFVENKGQVDRRVSYTVQGRDAAIYFTPGGLTFVLGGSAGEPNPRWVLKLDFVGANRGVRPVGVEKTPAVVSYFKGPREQWRTGLPTYSSVIYRDLWPGIDLVFAGTVDKMESTFVVRPGADPAANPARLPGGLVGGAQRLGAARNHDARSVLAG